MGRFGGKVALVTGAGSGIGRATALAFGREGARVVAADIAEAAGRETEALLKQAGAEARFVRCDVTRAEEVRAAVDAAMQSFGRLDVAHNNAGIEGVSALTHDMPEEAFDRTLAINLKGVFLCLRAEIPAMLASGGGSIVNTSSIAGLVGLAGGGAYAASKHGVVALTRTAALEYARKGIRVNAVAPAAIATPLIDRQVANYPKAAKAMVDRDPMGRMGTAEEVAAAALWLASDEASFVTGTVLSVDGGWVAQ